MPHPNAVSDEPIWNQSILREMVHDTQRSAQSRSWALETLARIGREEAAIALAVDLLADDEPNVSTHALTMLKEADGAECSQAVRNFSRREDVPLWSKVLATVFLASCGDEDAGNRAFDNEKARAYFGLWANRDPQGFADAVLDAWGDDLAADREVLRALATAAEPKLAHPLLEAIGKLDRNLDGADLEADAMVTTMARAGFGLPELGEDMPIVWHPRDELTFDSRVDDDALAARFDELADLVAGGAWQEVSEHCLETIGLLGEMGADAMDAPTLQWAFAMRAALVDDPAVLGGDYQRARLAFALQEAVLLVFDIEATLEERDGLEDVLDLYSWSVGSQRDRLEEIIEARWKPGDEHSDAITGWLEDTTDEADWFDALAVAARLPDYDISPCLLALVSEMKDDRAGYDIDWAADTLLEVLDHQPHAIARDPDVLLLGDDLVSDCTLQALGGQPFCWASDLVLERFDQLSATEENEMLWETLAELSDPRCLDPLIDQWQAGEHRLSHAIGFVADITDRLDELPDGVKQDLRELSRLEARYEKRMEAMIDGHSDLDTTLPDGDGIDLALQCTACQATDTYHFDELYLDHERDVDTDAPFSAILTDRVVECTHCHARDQIEATDRAERNLSAMLTVLIKVEHWPEDAPIQVWHPELWDGTTFERPTEGIDHLKSQAEAQPDRAEPWRRLGHFCTRFHADAQATSAYEHADSIDGKGVPEPEQLRAIGIPTAPVGPEEADELLSSQSSKRKKSSAGQTDAGEHPLHECLVSAAWRQVEGLCSVFVSRKAADDRYIAAAFLVDLGCQGVKEVIFSSTLDEHKYGELKARLENIHGALEECAPELAARILDTAVRFSLALGFFPPDDYFAAREMLTGYDPDAADEDVPTGEAGLPLYVGDPDAAEPVIERIYRRTGPDGFASL